MSAAARHRTRFSRRVSWPLLATVLALLGVLVARGTSVLSPLAHFLTFRSADLVSPADAINHVGERAQVCGLVASAYFAADSQGSPTFLNLDAPYPNQIFTAVVWIETRSRFAKPPETLKGETVCVSGTITTYGGRAQIIVRDPAEIVVRDPAQIEQAEPQETGFIQYGGKKYRVYSDGRRELME